MGYEVHKTKTVLSQTSKMNPLLKNFFDTLCKIGYQPKHIVDIGANHGNWTRLALQYFPDASYTLIEPQYWLKSHFQDIINDDKIKYFPVGVGKKRGNFNFTIEEHDDSSTFRISKEEAEKRGLRQEVLPVVTLDNLITENLLSIPDIVKIDAEGLDLEVMEGSIELFGKTEIFILEVAINNKFFTNTIDKTIRFMEKNGYRLFDITDLNKPFPLKFLWLAEVVFVKKGGCLDVYELKDLNRTGIKSNP